MLKTFHKRHLAKSGCRPFVLKDDIRIKNGKKYNSTRI